MKTALHNGNVISYYDSGSGFPLIFLHSFAHNKTMWLPQLAHFNALGYRTIAPDLRGHGDSTFDPKTHTIVAMGEDVTELLSFLALQESVVIGTSMGGSVALKMYRANPQLFSGLVLSNAKAEADTPEIKARRMNQIQYLKDNGLEKFVEANAPRRLSKKTLEQKPWVLDLISLLNLTISAESIMASLLALTEKSDDTDILEKIKVPTLVTTGSDDIHIPKTSSEILTQKISNSIHVVIDETAHVSNLESSIEYNDVLGNFLRASVEK
ncbi:MAG: alpha/beta hydrolase [Thaumarchaeota archaeon]|nr:alpha/beta hydrolase [Nitrososphaerota archaeon]